jgi:ribosomal protein L2
MPLGSILHSLSLSSNTKIKYARSAGTFVKLLQKDFENKTCRVRLPSKKEITIPLESMATFGLVSNPLHKNINLSKAGRSRWLGHKPLVRGVAKKSCRSSTWRWRR